jgi:hypothetical protein
MYTSSPLSPPTERLDIYMPVKLGKYVQIQFTSSDSLRTTFPQRREVEIERKKSGRRETEKLGFSHLYNSQYIY